MRNYNMAQRDDISNTFAAINYINLSKSFNSSSKKPVIVQKSKNVPPNCDYKITSPSKDDKNVNINPTIIDITVLNIA